MLMNAAAQHTIRAKVLLHMLRTVVGEDAEWMS